MPQYNPQTVYTTAPTSSTVVVQDDDDAEAAVAAGLIGFTAGIALGAAIDNDYYYGPYGWHGGAYMYDDAWDDWDDHREDAREDWQDHREDLVDERGDRAGDAREQRTERAQTTQEERTQRTESRQENRPESQAQREQRRTDAQAAGQNRSTSTATQESRGYSRDQAQARRTQRHQLGCILGLFEWTLRAFRQPARPKQSEQLARRRRDDAGERFSPIVSTARRAGGSARAPSLTAAGACNRGAGLRTFATPEDAVRALIDASKAKNGRPGRRHLRPGRAGAIDSAEPATARRNREVFCVAAAEEWHLDDQPDGTKLLVIGNEDWPFPVPLVKNASGWHFDTAAGNEEVISRRIGRNELASIQICRTYVAAQRLYAEVGHDGQPAGRYAKTFDSEPGRQNGLVLADRSRAEAQPAG